MYCYAIYLIPCVRMPCLNMANQDNTGMYVVNEIYFFISMHILAFTMKKTLHGINEGIY